MGDKDLEKGGFSQEERDAMRTRAKELAMETKNSKKRDEGEKAVLELIAAMDEADKALAMRLHELVKAHAPGLWPKPWYGMPGYAVDGRMVCFFQASKKFNVRYSTLGFQEAASLDEGDLWPTSFALLKLTSQVEQTIVGLLQKASKA